MLTPPQKRMPDLQMSRVVFLVGVECRWCGWIEA
jgi:hypothetical protein